MEPIGGLWGEGIGVRLAVVARWRGGEVARWSRFPCFSMPSSLGLLLS